MATLKLFLSRRFKDAFDFAFEAHKRQLRKGSGVPYLTHLMSVAALVGEYGGGEDEMIAALLHDAVEDQNVPLTRIADKYGPRVSDIVAACTKEKIDWKSVPADQVWPTMMASHEKYFAHLKESFHSVRLVSACDKLHNARHIVADLTNGRDIFAKMKGGPVGTTWYYRQLGQLFQAHGPAEIGVEISKTVARMSEFVPVGEVQA